MISSSCDRNVNGLSDSCGAACHHAADATNNECVKMWAYESSAAAVVQESAPVHVMAVLCASVRDDLLLLRPNSATYRNMASVLRLLKAPVLTAALQSYPATLRICMTRSLASVPHDDVRKVGADHDVPTA